MAGPMRLPDKVVSGEPVSAAAFNQLIEALRAAQVEAGPGLVMDVASGRTILSLAGGVVSRVVEGVITAVRGTEGDPVDAVTYDAVAVGRSGAILEDATPRYGRTYRDRVACIPARVGDFCLIVRNIDAQDNRTADLWVFSEQYGVRTCGTPRPAPRPLNEEDPPPPPPEAGSTGDTGPSAPDGGGEGTD